MVKNIKVKYLCLKLKQIILAKDVPNEYRANDDNNQHTATHFTVF